MKAAIATRDLTKHYRDVVAVDHLSIEVGCGEIYGFVGLNGAGKTTTIRMLLSMIRPTGGEARLLGQRVHPGARDLWSRVGYLVEMPHAYPELTVRENLEAVRRLRGIADAGTVDRILAQLALEPYAGRRTGTLSQGNAQRLGLAKALLHRPELLLLDEPANGLDPAGVAEIRDLLARLAEQGATVLMSSHILTEVARLATRIGVIHEGRLLEEVDSDELEKRLRRRLVVDTLDQAAAEMVLSRAGLAPLRDDTGRIEIEDRRAIEHPERIAELLVRAGVPPTLLQTRQEDLETHFLRLVGDGGRHDGGIGRRAVG